MAKTRAKDAGELENKSPKRKTLLAKRKLFLYSPSRVRNALAAVRNGMSVNAASNSFNVPRSTLRHKLAGRSPETSGHVGPSAVLGKDGEQILVNWINTLAKMGFPINKEALISSVQQMVQEGQFKTPFVNGRPGLKWFRAFLARNPTISEKRAEYINAARGSITERKIRGWFAEVEDLLGDDICILEEPERVFNMDETSFYLCPAGGLVLATKGLPVYDQSSNSDKENITTLITVNALGMQAPPLTVYKYERLPPIISKSAPPFWGLGKTEKGWMTGEAFYEYFANVFHPFLVKNGIKLPVVVFMDGHSSHLTIHLSRFCRENGIILVCLYPNTTHILQPLDVAFFFPLKTKWRSFLRKWRYDHHGAELRKHNVPSALNSILETESFCEAIVSGFRVCGLYPFDPNAVDYSKCTEKSTPQHLPERVPAPDRAAELQLLESRIDDQYLKEFRNYHGKGHDWDGDICASMLFDVWRLYKAAADTSRLTTDSADTPNLAADPVPDMATDPAWNPALDSTLDMKPDMKPDMKLDMAAGLEPDHRDEDYPDKEAHDTPDEVTVEELQILDKDSPSSSHCSPSNITMQSVLKTVLFWPGPKSSKRVSKKIHMPTVLTSEKWQEIYQLKEKEKKEQAEKKQKRKKKASTVKKMPGAKRKKNIPKQDSESEQENSDEFNVRAKDFVIVTYEDEFFPGQVVEVNNAVERAKVSVMTMSGSDWKWPTKEDILWYPVTHIKEVIRPPALVNNRQVWHVPEIVKYQKKALVAS